MNLEISKRQKSFIRCYFNKIIDNIYVYLYNIYMSKTWREKLENVFAVTGDSFSNIATDISESQLDSNLYIKNFLIWGDGYIYYIGRKNNIRYAKRTACIPYVNYSKEKHAFSPDFLNMDIKETTIESMGG